MFATTRVKYNVWLEANAEGIKNLLEFIGHEKCLQAIWCGNNHRVDKVKEFVHIFQIHTIFRGVSCDMCGQIIERDKRRHRCQHHCEHNVCHACHDSAHACIARFLDDIEEETRSQVRQMKSDGVPATRVLQQGVTMQVCLLAGYSPCELFHADESKVVDVVKACHKIDAELPEGAECNLDKIVWFATRALLHQAYLEDWVHNAFRKKKYLEEQMNNTMREKRIAENIHTDVVGESRKVCGAHVITFTNVIHGAHDDAKPELKDEESAANLIILGVSEDVNLEMEVEEPAAHVITFTKVIHGAHDYATPEVKVAESAANLVIRGVSDDLNLEVEVEELVANLFDQTPKTEQIHARKCLRTGISFDEAMAQLR